MSTHPIVDAGEWTKPLPQPDGVSERYWADAALGKLMIQQCPKCGHKQWYGRALCTACGADPEWIEAAGTGTVHTYTIVRQMGMKPFREELPYVVAMIELDEGPMIMGNVTHCDPADVHIGMPVDVHFVKVDDTTGIPYWRPGSS